MIFRIKYKLFLCSKFRRIAEAFCSVLWGGKGKEESIYKGAKSLRSWFLFIYLVCSSG